MKRVDLFLGITGEKLNVISHDEVRRTPEILISMVVNFYRNTTIS
jgi:hypothetical protein